MSELNMHEIKTGETEDTLGYFQKEKKESGKRFVKKVVLNGASEGGVTVDG